MRLLLAFCLLCAYCAPCPASTQCLSLDPADADAVNLYCLRTSYPEITGLTADSEGRQWLLLADGRRVLYSATPERDGVNGRTDSLRASPETHLALPHSPAHALKEIWDVDVRASMAEHYPLEPERPATPLGVSPGRRRPHALLAALYGANEGEVGRKLRRVKLLGRPLRLASPAVRALQNVDGLLAGALRKNPGLALLLKPAGGFAWRRIAGEQRLSPHSFGIALDLSPERAPYWRWSRQRPHPMQQSYPTAIVAAFEAQGFIWGGKWHEYDLMHFEYRPEIICKARVLRSIEKLRVPGDENPFGDNGD